VHNSVRLHVLITTTATATTAVACTQLATPNDILLLAVTEQDGTNRYDIRPTQFRTSSDGVSMLNIAAHPNGRVFMAGKDGSLYGNNYTTFDDYECLSDTCSVYILLL
jgi:hypothetical protein